jgi:hypothetical protein
MLFGFAGVGVFALYVISSRIDNNTVQAGVLDLEVEPKHIKFESDTDKTDSKVLTLTNSGTLPLQYDIEVFNTSHDCKYISAEVTSNGNYYLIFDIPSSTNFVPTGVLTGSEDISYLFNLKGDAPSRNINCEINLHLIAWQSEFVSPTEGFTDKEVVKYQIVFKKPEMGSLPIPGTDILYELTPVFNTD